MNEFRRKAKIAMLEKDLSFRDVAAIAGLTLGTVHNVLSGLSNSTRAREAITNALGTEIWDDVPVTERRLLIPKGTQIEFADECSAQQAEREFINRVTRDHRTLAFIRPMTAAFRLEGRSKRAEKSSI